MDFNITKTLLTLKEANDFINNVAYAGFTKTEDGSIQYSPFFQKLELKSNFLDYYTDYQHHENVEDDYAEFANFDFESDSRISQIYSSIQFKDILESIDEKVEYIKNQAFSISSTNDKNFEDLFVMYLSPLISKMNEMCEKETHRIEHETKAIMEAERLSKAQTKQIEYLNAVNENFTPEERASLEKSMADKDVDMNDLMSKLTDKYFSSDNHNDNVESLFNNQRETINKQSAEIKELKANENARNVINYRN
ncbi:hypothetical protein [Robinsoniella peoriensis]|uniref:hypothetical protein n=1 Tax=Robinsoniella peoriensis TaxID=180332 RepID=UPI0005C7C85A|nr:hypothetical protein [Robinsoniella peoriensis]